MTWPNWKGETVAVLATGMSLLRSPLVALRGRARVIAIKSTWRLAPWADMVYGQDLGWWAASVNRMKEFHGLKVSASPTVMTWYPDACQVTLKPVADVIMEPLGTIGCGEAGGGGHSGFQAMNLAAQMGARRILLLGMDMKGFRYLTDPGVEPLNLERMRRHREEMERTADQWSRLGVEVVNCSPDSALRAFPYVPVEEAA